MEGKGWPEAPVLLVCPMDREVNWVSGAGACMSEAPMPPWWPMVRDVSCAGACTPEAALFFKTTKPWGFYWKQGLANHSDWLDIPPPKGSSSGTG